MAEVSAATQMGKIRSFEKGFVAMHLVNLGAKLGFLEALNNAKEGMTAADLAASLGLHEPYVTIWCQTAYHFEILDCDDKGRFVLQPFMDEVLGDTKNPRNYLANIALDVDHLGRMLTGGVGYFKTGSRTPFFDSPERSAAGYAVTKNMALVFQFMIFPKHEYLKQSLEQGIRCLDIGCGDGALMIGLAKAFPNSTFVGVNPDRYGIEAAKSRVSKLGLDQRVSVENMGGQDLPYKNEFDIATLVVTLHEIFLEVRTEVVERAYEALNPGGRIVILDLLYPSKLEDFRDPMYDFGIMDQFYETCMGTVHFNSSEQDALLVNAGFKDIQRSYVGKGMFELIVAAK
ncbi:MAG: methyltransferase domain-containing protein [Deltaproteobacteria bacterium]|nr:methyltransferase domain-containing protein [Deltaproteobacteria bacterium]